MLYNVRLHIISPVHIGCDESYTPLEFVIDSDRKELIEFSLEDFINSLDERDIKRLNEISEKKSPTALVELYRFYSEKRNKIRGKRIPIPAELAERYRTVKQIKREEDMLKGFNEFDIPKTFYNPYTQKPVIPGSSIKGCLRTGYVDCLLREQENLEPYKNKGYTDIEAELLGGTMETDPFRLLKISDFEPEQDIKTTILYQINIKKEKGIFARGLSVPVEVIPEGSIFTGTIKIEAALPSSNIKNPINLKDLLLKAHFHYAEIFNEEYKLVKEKGFSPPEIDKFRDKIKKRFFLLRIGKHSGAEAVTWKRLRKIRVRTREGNKLMDSPTTIWLASEEKKPKQLRIAKAFGWVMLEVLDEDSL